MTDKNWTKLYIGYVTFLTLIIVCVTIVYEDNIKQLKRQLELCKAPVLPKELLDEFILAGHPYRLSLPKMIKCSAETSTSLDCLQFDTNDDYQITDKDIETRLDLVKKNFADWRRMVYQRDKPLNFLLQIKKEAEQW